MTFSFRYSISSSALPTLCSLIKVASPFVRAAPGRTSEVGDETFGCPSFFWWRDRRREFGAFNVRCTRLWAKSAGSVEGLWLWCCKYADADRWCVVLTTNTIADKRISQWIGKVVFPKTKKQQRAHGIRLCALSLGIKLTNQPMLPPRRPMADWQARPWVRKVSLNPNTAVNRCIGYLCCQCWCTIL